LVTPTSKPEVRSEDAMFDNLFLMLGPTALAFVLGPVLLAIGMLAAVPPCETKHLRGARPLAR
jgi:hypothetical protein